MKKFIRWSNDTRFDKKIETAIDDTRNMFGTITRDEIRDMADLKMKTKIPAVAKEVVPVDFRINQYGEYQAKTPDDSDSGYNRIETSFNQIAQYLGSFNITASNKYVKPTPSPLVEGFDLDACSLSTDGVFTAKKNIRLYCSMILQYKTSISLTLSSSLTSASGQHVIGYAQGVGIMSANEPRYVVSPFQAFCITMSPGQSIAFELKRDSGSGTTNINVKYNIMYTVM